MSQAPWISPRHVPQEMEHLLYYNGLAVPRRHGGWDPSPLRPDSPRTISVCGARLQPPGQAGVTQATAARITAGPGQGRRREG